MIIQLVFLARGLSVDRRQPDAAVEAWRDERASLGAAPAACADRELRGIILSSVLPRMPIGMNALGVTLLVQSQYQSFAVAGMVSAATVFISLACLFRT